MIKSNLNVATMALAIALVTVVMLALSSSLPISQAAADDDNWGPTWTTDGKLVLPKGYHEWVFLGSPLTPNALNGGQAGFPEYHNVYVHPKAFRAYKATGEWPEGTIMLKELQLVLPSDSPDGTLIESSGRGYFPGARNGIDISVKDSNRFADSNGWGFFNFGHHAPPYLADASAAPVQACAGCHIANADNMVFSKFYKPILGAD